MGLAKCEERPTGNRRRGADDLADDGDQLTATLPGNLQLATRALSVTTDHEREPFVEAGELVVQLVGRHVLGRTLEARRVLCKPSPELLRRRRTATAEHFAQPTHCAVLPDDGRTWTTDEGSRSRLPNYSMRMQGNAEVVALLNDLLRHELTAINQYLLHAETCARWGYDSLASK